MSPSWVNTALRCPLAGLFRLDPDTRQGLPPSDWALVGMLAHSVVAAWPGSAQTDPAALWKEEEQRLYVRAAAEHPYRTIPAPRTWRSYALVKVRILRSLPPKTVWSPAPTPNGTAQVHRERRFEDTDTGLYGTPDRVELGKRMRVVDLKTGLSQSEPTADQRRQLLLYAHLVQHTYGRVPSEAAIVDARGNETPVAVHPADVAAAVAAASRAAAQVSAASDAAAVRLLARPSPVACGHCPYRAACPAFWKSVDTDWPGAARVALGVVHACSAAAVTMAPVAWPRGADRITLGLSGGQLISDAPQPGDLLAATEVRTSPGRAQADWQSHVVVRPRKPNGDTSDSRQSWPSTAHTPDG